MYKEVRLFVENKPGKLSKLAELLGNAGVDILAIKVSDEGQYGVFKILTATPEKAKDALEAANMTVSFNEVICIEMNDEPGGLLRLAKAMDSTGLNVTDAYGCILERHKRAVFVIEGADLVTLETAIKNAGLKVLDSLE